MDTSMNIDLKNEQFALKLPATTLNKFNPERSSEFNSHEKNKNSYYLDLIPSLENLNKSEISSPKLFKHEIKNLSPKISMKITSHPISKLNSVEPE